MSENVVISSELADAIDRALTKTITSAIAHYSSEPYPDDPRWSPWTRFGKRLADRAGDARRELRALRMVDEA